MGNVSLSSPQARGGGKALGVWSAGAWWSGRAWRGKSGSPPLSFSLLLPVGKSLTRSRPQRPQGVKGGSCESLHVPHRSMLFQWGNGGSKTKSPDVCIWTAHVCVHVCAGVLFKHDFWGPAQTCTIRNGPKNLPSDKGESQGVRRPQVDRCG